MGTQKGGIQGGKKRPRVTGRAERDHGGRKAKGTGGIVKNKEKGKGPTSSWRMRKKRQKHGAHA